MYNCRTITRRGARMCGRFSLAAAVAAMVIAAQPGVRAADTTMTTTTTTTINGTSIMIPTVAPAPTGPNGQRIDFMTLVNSPFDYLELSRAHNEGFSDTDVAAIAKISDKTGVPFSTIESQALIGMTWETLANRYNLRLKDVRDVSDYQDKIAAYKLAYENSGSGQVRNLVAASQQEFRNPSPPMSAAPSTIVTPNTLTNISPNGTTTTMTPNGTTTVEPNGNTTVTPAAPGSTTITPNANGSTTVTPNP